MPELWRIEAGRKGGSAGKGKPKSAEHRTKIAAASMGRAKSVKEIAKISEATKRAHREGRCHGQRKGWQPSAETRAAMSAGQAKRRAEMGEEAFAAWVAERNHKMLKWHEQSSLERWVQAWLEEHDIRFEPHVKIGNYTVDFLVDDWLVIEVNGCYWHRCKACGIKDDIRARFRDARRYRSLRSKGYEVAVVWEHDLQEVMRG